MPLREPHWQIDANKVSIAQHPDNDERLLRTMQWPRRLAGTQKGRLARTLVASCRVAGNTITRIIKLRK
jgi:hypothetical protein